MILCKVLTFIEMNGKERLFSKPKVATLTVIMIFRASDLENNDNL